jgi:hypothetical protein
LAFSFASGRQLSGENTGRCFSLILFVKVILHPSIHPSVVERAGGEFIIVREILTLYHVLEQEE